MKDITGQRFGKLIALYRTDKKRGTEIDVAPQYLKSSKNPSCGYANYKSYGSIVRNWDKTEARLTKK